MKELHFHHVMCILSSMKDDVYTATYYERLYLDTEAWYAMDDCVCIATPTHIIDIIPYTVYRKDYSPLPFTEKVGTYIPAFINAHSHIDNAYLYQKTMQGQGFYPWLCSMLSHRKEEEYIQSYLTATFDIIATMLEDTAYIASIASAPWLDTILTEYTVPHCTLYESIGGTANTPPHSEPSLLYHTSYAGHALYSTHAHILQELKMLCTAHGRPFSIHLAEHREECDFLQGRASDFSLLIQERLMPEYLAPYQSPVAYAYGLGLLDCNTLAVHCVHCDTSDIELLQQSGATVCLCPRSNTYIGVGIARAQDFYMAGIPLCIATDGLASAPSLSMWAEVRYAMELYHFTLEQCIPMATAIPARILGIDTHFGKLQRGYYPKTTQIPDEYL